LITIELVSRVVRGPHGTYGDRRLHGERRSFSEISEHVAGVW
jgi:hypothetical protein